MAESEDLDVSSDLSLIRNRERMLQLLFYSKRFFFKYVDANDLLKTFYCSNFKKFIDLDS